MENILSLIYTLFAFCYCREEHNITFHENKATWDEAVRYCADSGGVLYSDEADIRNKTDYGDDEVWTGKYIAFTPWAITLGCYRINFDDNSRNIFSVQHSEQPECQKICIWTNFFAIKGRKCKCVQRDELRVKDRIRPCNCTTCVTVLRHGIAKIRKESETGCSAKNTKCLCVAATCEFTKLTLTPEICSNDYKSIRDNNITLHPAEQIEANTFCYNQNSILRWYTTDKDICDHGVAQHWTSGRRSVHEYIVQHNGDGSDLNPLQCFRVKKDNNDESFYTDCDKIFPFFCKIGGNMKEDVSPPNVIGQANKSNSTAGVIGGTVSAILIISIVALTGIFLYKRRRTLKETQMRIVRSQDRPTKVNSDGQYHEIDMTNVNYSVSKPLSNSQELTNTIAEDTSVYQGSSRPISNTPGGSKKADNLISNPGYYVINLKDNSNTNHSVNSKGKLDEAGKMNSSDYDLAKPISDTEEFDTYTANTDYDHLNNVKKPEISDVKFYDHLKNATESDPTYDHSGVTVRKDNDNYEHFNVEK